ncbi:hypothetical protein HPP92_020246 [Vanilla planifolia]|uniref:Uncharacterized protein n=1 Tax=Vanilla planifolia TaxID=51239 RepID=A0A835Q7B8_VANPL|nr:hypothetical protein HPP92_020246 [Vanilla planifolia]
MADPARSGWSTLLLRAMSMRRTWLILFLLSSSWSILFSIRSGYDAAAALDPERFGGPALYASFLYGGVFGVLTMGAALAVAVPATVVTWITVLVLLAFAGKPRRTLVTEGRRITADVAGFAVKVLFREGNVVAAVCIVVSFVALILRRRGLPAQRGEDM